MFFVVLLVPGEGLLFESGCDFGVLRGDVYLLFGVGFQIVEFGFATVCIGEKLPVAAPGSELEAYVFGRFGKGVVLVSAVVPKELLGTDVRLGSGESSTDIFAVKFVVGRL